MFGKKNSSRKSRAATIVKYYVVKPNGAVTLDLARAAKSDAFKESVRRIRENELRVESAG